MTLSVLNPHHAMGDGLTVAGKGWGHGVGFSQYGARAMADAGDSAHEILSHYFPSTVLRQINTLSVGSQFVGTEAPMWVGLLQNQPEITFQIEEGAADLCFDQAGDCSVTAAKGEKWKWILVKWTRAGSVCDQCWIKSGRGFVTYKADGIKILT